MLLAMPRFSWTDALRAWIDPEVLGLAALPLPIELESAGAPCGVCGASMFGVGSDSPHGLVDWVAQPQGCAPERCELPDGIDALIALGDYAGPAGQAVRLIKGTCWADGAWWWGSALGERLLESSRRKPDRATGAATPSELVLVPVPGDRWRTLVRGIDHAAALARAASATSGWPWKSLLARQDHTRQASRGARNRRAIQGRFAIHSKVSHVPECVVLVDDVCTTGSTGADCARALRRAGASWVAMGVLARSHR